MTQARQCSSVLQDGFGSQKNLQIQTVLITSYLPFLSPFIYMKGEGGNSSFLPHRVTMRMMQGKTPSLVHNTGPLNGNVVLLRDSSSPFCILLQVPHHPHLCVCLCPGSELLALDCKVWECHPLPQLHLG